jgi:hypothetical protein
MSGIMDVIQQHITPDTIKQISSAIGEDPAKTQQAVNAALPHLATAAEQAVGTGATPAGQGGGGATESLLGGLGGMMSGAGGAGTEGGGMLGGLAGMMGGNAGDILGNILGGRHAEVQQGVAKQSGLDPQKAGQLLTMLAPIVMQAIAKYRQQQSGPRP